MAISEIHFRLLCELRDRGTFKPGGSLLEIGEANWYGDFDPQLIVDQQSNESDRLLTLDAIAREDSFALAQMIYRATIKNASGDAIDYCGTDRAARRDLNVRYEDGPTYDVVINNGTAEHIFNIGQVFESMHRATKIGGVMIHEAPFVGWVDHGFYSLQPTLFYDLARANNYRIELIGVMDITAKKFNRLECREAVSRLNGEMPKNGELFVVYRKVFDVNFSVPMQGVYTNLVSDEIRKAHAEQR